MGLFSKLKEKAIAQKQRIVLPESTEYRTLQAANQVIAEGIADIILIGDPAKIKEQAEELGLTHIHLARIVNTDNDAEIEKYAESSMSFANRRVSPLKMPARRLKTLSTSVASLSRRVKPTDRLPVPRILPVMCSALLSRLSRLLRASMWCRVHSLCFCLRVCLTEPTVCSCLPTAL